MGNYGQGGDTVQQHSTCQTLEAVPWLALTTWAVRMPLA